MDYSELVVAVKSEDTKKINKLVKAIRPRLLAFLRIHMNASHADAKDISQEALLTIIKVIKEDQLKKPDQVVKYLLSICKNTYLKEKEKNKSSTLVAEPYYPQAPHQLQAMMDKEQKRLLHWCLQQLKAEYREYMQYWFKHPDANAQIVAEHFNISLSNAWTRKHRLIKKLNECYQKKSNL